MESKTKQKNVTKTKKKSRAVESEEVIQGQAASKSRAKYRCPEALKRLIDLVNSIPPDRKLPPPSVLDNLAEGRWQLAQMIAENLHGVPESFINDEGFNSYQTFRFLRRSVHLLAQVAQLPERLLRSYAYHQDEMNGQDKVIEWPKALRKFLGNEPWSEPSRYDLHVGQNMIQSWDWPQLSIRIEIDRAAGLTMAKGHKWLDALIGFEVDRLRECRVCQRIFWAKRKDAWACAPPTTCGATLRQRNKREQEPDYEATRAEKERRAKARKKVRG